MIQGFHKTNLLLTKTTDRWKLIFGELIVIASFSFEKTYGTVWPDLVKKLSLWSFFNGSI